MPEVFNHHTSHKYIMNDIIEKIGTLKLMPVIALEDPDKAPDLSEALKQGGLRCAEITFRTKNAAAAIQKIAEDREMLVAAGTILTLDQAAEAMDAGADFLIAPGFNRELVEYCRDRNIFMVPGVCTPSEIEMALAYDLKVLKFFPAEACGGVAFIKAVSSPYPMVQFIPTGGIHQENLSSYLECKSVLACGGSWFVNKTLLNEARFDEIRDLTRQALVIAERFPSSS